MNKIFLLAIALLYLLSACGPDQGLGEVSYLEKMNSYIEKRYATIESLQDATNSITAPVEIQNMQPKRLALPASSQLSNMVQESNILDGVANEVLPQINTAENRNIVHPYVVNHYRDVHRYQNANHHVNVNHIHDVRHRYFTRIFNHPSTSFSESATAQVVESGEVIPPTETTLPIVPCN
jgi:hypothetical protein